VRFSPGASGATTLTQPFEDPLERRDESGGAFDLRYVTRCRQRLDERIGAQPPQRVQPRVRHDPVGGAPDQPDRDRAGGEGVAQVRLECAPNTRRDPAGAAGGVEQQPCIGGMQPRGVGDRGAEQRLASTRAAG